MRGILLDTHFWVWLQGGLEHPLREEEVEVLRVRGREGNVFLSDISVLEVARLQADGLLQLPGSVEMLVQDATDTGLRFLPLNRRVLIASTRLPGTVHRDPADRLLIATAREHELMLLTRDRNILRHAAAGLLKASKVPA